MAEAGETQQAGRMRRCLPWLPPLLLVLLAGVQIGLVHAVQLTPWKGGGFGMFSTLDHGGFRSVRVYTTRGDKERRVSVPSDLVRMARRVRDMPSQAMSLRLARALRSRHLEAGAIRVEVSRLVFDPVDLRPRRHTLSETVLEGGS